MAEYVLSLIGLVLIGVGIALSFSNRGAEGAGGSALGGKITGPAWLVLVVLGVFCIAGAGVYDWEDDPPVEDEFFDDFEDWPLSDIEFEVAWCDENFEMDPAFCDELFDYWFGG